MQAQVQDQETTAVVTLARAVASHSTSIALARQSGVGGSCNGFRWTEVKNLVCRVYTFYRCGTNRGQTRTHLELWLARSCCRSSCRVQTATHARPPPLLDMPGTSDHSASIRGRICTARGAWLSRICCSSSRRGETAAHALHFRLLCLQSRSATYSLRVFAFSHLLHVILSRTDCCSHTASSSARHALHFRSRRSQSRFDAYAARVWATPQRLHALRFELRSMQLRQRAWPHHKLYNASARHSLCILDAASTAGPQVRKPPRILKVGSPPYSQTVHLRQIEIHEDRQTTTETARCRRNKDGHTQTCPLNGCCPES